MADYTTIQTKIDYGRGIAGRILGPPFSVYRIQDNTALNWFDAENQIATSIPMFRRPKEGQDVIEGAWLGTVVFELLTDFSQYQLGDVFLQADTIYGVGSTIVPYSTLEIIAFALAFHGPVKKTMGALLNRLAYVSRPLQGTDSGGYFSGDASASVPLTLVGGSFALGNNPGVTPTLVPVGLNSAERWRAQLYKRLPASTGESVWYIYVPPTPGFTFREGDFITTQDGAQYVVQNPYEQQTGFVGSMMSVVRTGSQP